MLKYIDIKYVKVWYQANTAWKNVRKTNNKRLLVPELLLKDDELIKVDYKNKINYAKLSINDETKYIDISKLDNLKIKKQLKIHEFPINDSDSLRPLKLESKSTKQIWFTIHVPDEAIAGKYTGKIIKTPPEQETALKNRGTSLTVIYFQIAL